MASFRTYVAKVLLPTLRPGDIVVFGQSRQPQKQSRASDHSDPPGAKLFFLPKYSPDLNPIEQVFAKLEASRQSKRHAARTVDAVCAAIGDALPS